VAQWAGGGSADDLAQLEAMRGIYRNPLFRFSMTMTEILSVGVLVSLVTAVLLPNPPFLSARGLA
jgi:hypothetical protein